MGLLALVLIPLFVVVIEREWGGDQGGSVINWQPGLPTQEGAASLLPTVGPEPTPTGTPLGTAPTPAPTVPAAGDAEPLTADQRRELAPNELGVVPVLMYHDIVDVPSTDVAYTRTLDDFRAELQRLYDLDYYVAPLEDFVLNQMDVPAGKHPVVLTFDDGIANQFRFLISDDGTTSIDPTSAVGVLEAFFAEHPDFGRGGFFAVPPSTCFDWTAAGAEPDQTPYCAEKLAWLLDNGYEVGNHTYDHADLLNLDDATFQEKVGAGTTLLQAEEPRVTANVIAMPFGNYPDAQEHPNQREWLRNGFVFDGVDVSFIGALMVGANPAASPASTEWDPLFIARIQAYDGELGSTEWLDLLEADPGQLHTSDGNPDTISVPSVLHPALAGTLDVSPADGRTILLYDPTTGEVDEEIS